MRDEATTIDDIVAGVIERLPEEPRRFFNLSGAQDAQSFPLEKVYKREALAAHGMQTLKGRLFYFPTGQPEANALTMRAVAFTNELLEAPRASAEWFVVWNLAHLWLGSDFDCPTPEEMGEAERLAAAWGFPKPLD